MCNMKGVAPSYKPTENYLAASSRLNILQLIVLVVWPTILMSWFTLTALINLDSSYSKQVLKVKVLKPLMNSLFDTCPAPSSKLSN